MVEKTIYKILTYSIAAVWFVNGLFCKVLNLVPRHEQIVARILRAEQASLFTKLIGVSEILMAIWILTGIKSHFNVWTQILIIVAMNAMEYKLVPDLLLWGKFNSLYAFLFINIILCNEFFIKKKIIKQT